MTSCVLCEAELETWPTHLEDLEDCDESQTLDTDVFMAGDGFSFVRITMVHWFFSPEIKRYLT